MPAVGLTMRDLDRLKVIQEAIDGRLKIVQAAEQLDLTDRHVRRLCANVRKHGPGCLAHALRGKPSNNRTDEDLVDRALALVKEHYQDFGPTLASEKLLERHGVDLSAPTLRRRMIPAGMWRPRRYKKRHRAWRPRKACMGELVQVDGSDHDWFEGRGPRCTLIVFIDDATSRILWAEFAKVEDTLTLMRLAGSYLRRRGRPWAFYVDRDSIYTINKGQLVGEQLREEQPLTQFTRAMRELDIRVQCASSPQAKGRVERGFKTHQDRLVKELRLAGANSIEQANLLLRSGYLKGHNKRFSVPPASRTDAHRPLHPEQRLDRILSLRSERTIFNDFTLRWKGQFLQLLERQQFRIKPGQHVQVEVRLDGSMHVKGEDGYLNYKTIAKPRYRPFLVAQPSNAKQRIDPRTKGVGSKPSADHPWRRLFDQRPYSIQKMSLALDAHYLE